ncbi:MAG: pyridoxal-phosphate dependent enzyme, partial [Candidatus Lokiarchaeota archaeon]|nr:pyridoxal-phosphate dependent enzyme [Candidatus Lokiarchaeota archaeon]
MSFQGIEEAFQRINSIANKTPVMTSRTLNTLFKSDMYFKCENFQRVGTFKFRGAYNTLSLLTEKQKKQGVITHSSGNHAQALALAASLLGIQATIVMPKGAPVNKINATKGYGAEIVFCDNNLESRAQTTDKLIERNNSILIHPYDNDNIINGQGTAAFELIKEVGDLDLVIAPLGGGGLLSGTGIATKGLCPNAHVIGVEPTMADDALRSLKAGYIIPSTYPNTIADGL